MHQFICSCSRKDCRDYLLLRTSESRRHSMHDQHELNRIWEHICYGDFDGEYCPQKVFENKDIQIMYIPSESKTGFDVYERKRGSLWILLPALRKQA
jgi:hypothetical protein